MAPSSDFVSNPEVKELVAQAGSIESTAKTYQVKTAEDYAAAGEELARIKGAQKRLDTLRKTITQPMDAAKKAVLDFFRPHEERMRQAESLIKRQLIAYSDEQERIQREEQRKANEAAEKERQKIAARAVKAEASGKVEKAEQLQQQAAMVVAPVINREPPKIATLGTSKVWKWEITDPSKINPAFMMPDEKKIGAQVRALKGDAAPLIGPGVRVWEATQLASGAA